MPGQSPDGPQFVYSARWARVGAGVPLEAEAVLEDRDRQLEAFLARLAPSAFTRHEAGTKVATLSAAASVAGTKTFDVPFVFLPVVVVSWMGGGDGNVVVRLTEIKRDEFSFEVHTLDGTTTTVSGNVHYIASEPT